MSTDDERTPDHDGPPVSGAPADSEITQRFPTASRDPRVDYVGPPPGGFFQAREPDPGDDGGRDRSTVMAAVALALVVVIGGGLLLAYVLTRGDGDEAPVRADSSAGQHASGDDYSHGLRVTSSATRGQVLQQAYAFLDRVRAHDCEGAMAMTGRTPDSMGPVVTHITRRYVCLGRIVNATRRGFAGTPRLNDLGGTFWLSWNDKEMLKLDVVRGRLAVTWFRADIYR